MRNLIIARLEELKRLHDDFDSEILRWNGVEVNGVQIGEIDFKKLNDFELLEVLEYVICEIYGGRRS